MSEADEVTVTTRVEVDVETAFRVFTEEIGSWWRRDERFCFDPNRVGTLRFELGDPGRGEPGRLVEVHESESGDPTEIGRIKAWERPNRLLFDFRMREFKTEESTEVEVRFEPAGDGTRVTVVHRGWNRLPADHPARRGMRGSAFENLIGSWWADLLIRWRQSLS